jgi:hypothetical protein
MGEADLKLNLGKTVERPSICRLVALDSFHFPMGCKDTTVEELFELDDLDGPPSAVLDQEPTCFTFHGEHLLGRPGNRATTPPRAFFQVWLIFLPG